SINNSHFLSPICESNPEIIRSNGPSSSSSLKIQELGIVEFDCCVTKKLEKAGKNQELGI
ncbi:hypothetical protein MKW98_002339, partial [Papaver atlanticum]